MFVIEQRGLAIFGDAVLRNFALKQSSQADIDVSNASNCSFAYFSVI